MSQPEGSQGKKTPTTNQTKSEDPEYQAADIHEVISF